MVILATSTSMISKKREEELEQISFIQYLITFKDQTEALLNFERKVNIMNPAFASQFSLKI